MEYRAYTVGSDGYLNVPRVFVAADDELALAVVKSFLNGKPVELWEGARMVAWCEHVDEQVVILRPDELQRA